MHKSLFLVFILLITGTMLCAGDYIIGTGTSTQNYLPLYGYANYSWSKFFYTADEMIDAGFTTSEQITKISFQVGNEVSDYFTGNQQVYMRAFYDSEYASATASYPGTSGFYLVYNGSVTWSGPGWIEITLDTPYNYNPLWGIEILWENRDGSAASGYPKCQYTSTGVYNCVYKSGSTFPTTSGTRYKNRPNIWFTTPSTEPPTPAVTTSPNDLSTDNPITTTLRWNHTGGSPTGYRLWFGTNNPPSNLISALVVTSTTYTPEDYLDYGATYYWRVVPYNENGPATDCPVWSFSTIPDPSIEDFPYVQDFSGAFPPTAWDNWKGNLSDPIVFTIAGSTSWIQDDWLNNAGENKAARFNVWGPLEGYLISPMFKIPTEDFEIEFDIALLKANQSPTGTPPALTGTDDRFAVLIGDGYTWSTANIIKEWNNSGSDYVFNNIATSGQKIRIPIGEHTGRIRIAIYTGSTVLNADNDFMIDN